MIYADSVEIVNELSDEQAGQLFKAMFHWQKNGTIPDNLEFGMKMAIMPFISQFKRDDEAYLRKVERNRANGQKGGRKPISENNLEPIISKSPILEESEPNSSEKTETEETQENPKNPLGSLATETNHSQILGCNTKTKTKNKTKKNIELIDKLLIHFNVVFSKRCSIVPDAVVKKYEARLKEGFTLEMIQSAMTNASKDKFHQESKYQHCTMEFFSRPDKIDKFCNISEKTDSKYIATL